jgi:TrkA domain protein
MPTTRASEHHRPVHVPGVGIQHTFVDDDGRTLTALLRHNGTSELHHTDPAGVHLSPAATRALAAALAGHVTIAPDLVERLADVTGGLAFDWVRLGPASPFTALSIEDGRIRERTGVTIVAVLRSSLPIVAPGPHEVLHTGDELVVVGRARDVERFVETCGGGG